MNERSLADRYNPPQNEYTQLLARRVAEVKAKKTEVRKRRASSMRK